MSKIPSSVIRDASKGLRLGERRRTNHEACPAGEDTRRRLYTWRPSDKPGLTVGFCQNCQRKGVYFSEQHDKAFRLSDGFSHGHPLDPSNKFTLPKNILYDWSDPRYPLRAMEWLRKGNISLGMAHDWSIGFDLDSERLFIPNCGIEQYETTQYQLRRLVGDGPKYITARDPECTGLRTFYHPSRARAKVVVIVEDMLSAINVANAGFKGVPLYSSNTNMEDLYGLVKEHGADARYVVWLDNDNATVCDHAREIARRLTLILGHDERVYYLLHEADPKLHGPDKIKEIIERRFPDDS